MCLSRARRKRLSHLGLHHSQLLQCNHIVTIMNQLKIKLPSSILIGMKVNDPFSTSRSNINRISDKSAKYKNVIDVPCN